MSIVVVGSHALYARGGRTPGSDFDLIGSYDDLVSAIPKERVARLYPTEGGKKLFIQKKDGAILDCEIAWPGSTGEAFIHYTTERAGKILGFADIGLAFVPTLPLLYALKMSHRFLRNSPHFEKTYDDIMLMRSCSGAYIPEWLEKWYARREKETYNYPSPVLNTNKDGFFQDSYVYDHDSIHKAVKLGEKPSYEHFKKEGVEVLTCNKKFLAVSDEIKLNAVYEEASVLALERSLIPHPGKKTVDEAFKFALQKVCTSITSGPFREFAWENYRKVLKMHDDFARMGMHNYQQRFERGVADGTVKVA